MLKEIETKTVFKNNLIEVQHNIVQDQRGTMKNYLLLSQGKVKKVWVVSIPSFKEKYLLLKVYRYAIHDFSWEFCRGWLKKNESSVNGAKRELLEETGLKGEKYLSIGESYTDNGLLSSKISFISCTLKSIKSISLQKEELIVDYSFKSLFQIQEMIKKGIITDSFTIQGVWFLSF